MPAFSTPIGCALLILALLLTPGAARAAGDATRLDEGEAEPATVEEPAEAPVFYETTTVTARPVSSASGGVTVVDSKAITRARRPVAAATSCARCRASTSCPPADAPGSPTPGSAGRTPTSRWCSSTGSR